MNQAKVSALMAVVVGAGLQVLPAQAAITAEEQEQIVAQVVQQLEADKKVPQYISVASDAKGETSNIRNDGAQAENSIAIGGSARTTGSYNVYIGDGVDKEHADAALRTQAQRLYGEDNVVIGYRNDLGSRGKDDLHLRQTVFLGAKNSISKGNSQDAGSVSPVYSMAYGYKNALYGSYAVAFGQGNKVRNSSRTWAGSNFTSQDYAWVMGSSNDVFATGYVIGDKNFINTLPTYDPNQVINQTGADLYVMGRMNLIGSSDEKNTFVYSGTIVGQNNKIGRAHV